MANSNGIAFGNNYGPITTANTMGKGKGSQILRRTMWQTMCEGVAAAAQKSWSVKMGYQKNLTTQLSRGSWVTSGSCRAGITYTQRWIRSFFMAGKGVEWAEDDDYKSWQILDAG